MLAFTGRIYGWDFFTQKFVGKITHQQEQQQREKGMTSKYIYYLKYFYVSYFFWKNGHILDMSEINELVLIRFWNLHNIFLNLLLNHMQNIS